MESPVIFGGIEGGGGHSVVVLFDILGRKIIEMEFPISTNFWLVGMEECQKRINNLIQQAKKEAGLPAELTLTALGLSLSGCEDKGKNEEFKTSLVNRFPGLSKNYMICSDTVGSIATASGKGGLAIISGTGSNSFLLNPDDTTARCGGLGHLLGDEGSAFWVSGTAIKTILDEEDNRRCPPHDTEVAKRLMLDHFGIHNCIGLMEHCFTKFNKAIYAGFCAKLAVAARQGDSLCRHIFQEAGRMLGEFVAALLPSVDQALLEEPDGLPVICVGAVWKSFDLMKEGFIKGAASQPGPRKSSRPLRSIRLLQLRTSLAVGAAYLGAQKAGVHLTREYDANVYVFFRHTYQ